jgi:hypothetical protein
MPVAQHPKQPSAQLHQTPISQLVVVVQETSTARRNEPCSASTRNSSASARLLLTKPQSTTLVEAALEILSTTWLRSDEQAGPLLALLPARRACDILWMLHGTKSVGLCHATEALALFWFFVLHHLGVCIKSMGCIFIIDCQRRGGSDSCTTFDDITYSTKKAYFQARCLGVYHHIFQIQHSNRGYNAEFGFAVITTSEGFLNSSARAHYNMVPFVILFISTTSGGYTHMIPSGEGTSSHGIWAGT